MIGIYKLLTKILLRDNQSFVCFTNSTNDFSVFDGNVLVFELD